MRDDYRMRAQVGRYLERTKWREAWLEVIESGLTYPIMYNGAVDERGNPIPLEWYLMIN